MTKQCSVCCKDHSLNQYHKKRSAADGYRSECKDCVRIYQQKYRQPRREKHKEYCRQWYERNRAAVQEYINANKERRNANSRAWNQANPDKRRVADQKYRQAVARDPVKKLRSVLRSRLISALRGKSKGASAVRDLGCSIDELRVYLESQFTPGMSWANWSKDGWHIDHVRPLSSFDLTDPEQCRQACHYTNLQPLWATENLRKGDKWPAA